MAYTFRIPEPLEAWPVGFRVRGQEPGTFVIPTETMPHVVGALRYCELLDTELAGDPAAPDRRSPKGWLVPAFKFTADAPWRVVPDECTLLAEGIERLVLGSDLRFQVDGHLGWELDILEEEGLEALDDLLRELATFHSVAADRGGYVVEAAD